MGSTWVRGGAGRGRLQLWPERARTTDPLSAALRQAAHDVRGSPEVGQFLHGIDTAGSPFTTLGKQANKLMTSHPMALWGHRTIRLWPVICGGGPTSIQKADVQRYMGDTVDISTGAHTMLESIDVIDFLAFASRGGGGIKRLLAQHLGILGHAIVTIAARGFPHDPAELQAVRARVEALR